jgi:integrase
MGGKLKPGIKYPRGVKPRQFETEERIQIAFTYKGVECRELMPPGTVTQTAVNLAAGKRAEIQNKIAQAEMGLAVFLYADYFPNSPRAAQFDSTGRRVMLAALLQKTLEAYEQQVKNGKMAKSTLDGYTKAVNSKRMQEFVQGRAIATVLPSELRIFIGGIGSTAKFVRNLLTPLRATFEDALNDDLIKTNPFERVAMTALLKKTTTASDYEVDPFTEAERAQILKAARADEKPQIQFWLAAGLRPGEMIAFKWPKVDWTNRKGRVDLNQVSKEEKLPKTAAGIRDVDLNDDAIAALFAQKSVSYEAGEHVWLNPRTGKAWSTDAQVRKTLWQPLLERAGVRYRNPYQCRHTFASALLTGGANPWYVAEQLGHADVQLVYTTYGKFIREDYLKPKQQPALRVV